MVSSDYLLTALLKPEAPPDMSLIKLHLLETSGRCEVCRPPPSLVLELPVWGSPEVGREDAGRGAPAAVVSAPSSGKAAWAYRPWSEGA